MQNRTLIIMLLSILCLAIGIYILVTQQDIPIVSNSEKPQTLMQQQWQSEIQALKSTHKLIGVAGGIMHEGKVVALTAHGLEIKGQKTALSTENLFHIGSITKSMTATLLARLVEQGTLHWDISIADVFKDIEIHADWEGVTLEHFLTHIAGAPANFPMVSQSISADNHQALRAERLTSVTSILAAPPITKPGKSFTYSNVGLTIAGVIAEQLTGETWENLMQVHVFTPLDLKSAGFGAPLPTDEISQPWGHRKTFGFKRGVDPFSDASDNSPIMGPAGIIHMDLRDLLTFGNEHALGAKGKSTFLTPETYARLHTPKLNEYAYGIVVQKHKEWANGPVIWHNGSNTMWHALLVILPESQTVIVVASNDGSAGKAEPDMVKMIKQLPSLLATQD